MAEEIYYYPYGGEVLPGGSLRVPTAWTSTEGERLSGWIVATPEDPSYALWLSQIENKDTYWAAYREELKQAREQRRQKSKLQKTLP